MLYNSIEFAIQLQKALLEIVKDLLTESTARMSNPGAGFEYPPQPVAWLKVRHLPASSHPCI